MQTQTLRTFSLPQLSQKHAVSIALVVAIHVVLITALWKLGVVEAVLAPPPDPIVNVKIDPAIAPPPTPTIVDPKFVKPDVFVPVPDLTISPTTEPDGSIDARTTNTPPPPPETATRAQGIGYTHSEPPYPPMSIRLNEQGVVSLRLAISESGDVVGVTVLKSSGFARLDQAAVTHVKAHWRYHPAMRGGQPVASSVDAQLKFELKGR